MKASERRSKILKQLEKADEPISASALASAAGVSRQVVVGDIALLRASGASIISTPRGYVLETSEESHPGHVMKIACRHRAEKMVEELQICVDNGCQVLDVIVEHPVYGQLTGILKISSRYDIEQFEAKVASSEAHALSELTDGVHLHTLICPSIGAYERVCAKLREKGILLKE